MNFRDFLEEQLKNPEIRKAYEALELKYTIVGGVNGVGKPLSFVDTKNCTPVLVKSSTRIKLLLTWAEIRLPEARLHSKRSANVFAKGCPFCRKPRSPVTKHKPQPKKHWNKVTPFI